MADTIARIRSLLAKANAVTGGNDADLTAAVEHLAAGFGASGDAAKEDALVERSLTSYRNDRVRTVGTAAFMNWSGLKEAELPNVAAFTGPGVFSGAGIVTAAFPSLMYGGGNDFKFCSSLQSVLLPRYTRQISFNGCKLLRTVDLGTREWAPVLENELSCSIASGMFSNCTMLETMILRPEGQIYDLVNKNALASTGIEKGTGYIYVPRVLVEQYKTATNWVTYRGQIRAIEDYPEITGGAENGQK